jgi:hypothetical protein
MLNNSVLRLNGVEETSRYRTAVAQILLDIQRSTGATHIEIAENIDVSLGTISASANKKSDLNATYLKRLGERYGAHCLDPYLALFGARSVPLDRGNISDLLPLLNRASLKIAEARDPASPAGPRETHTEKLGYLPSLKALQCELSKMICEIEELRAA